VGQGALTAAFGFVLSAIGYNGALEVQSASTIAGIDAFFKYGPLVVAVILLVDIWLLDVETKNPQYIKEIAERKAAKKAAE
jgi:GPH family glycoside/pentoside/hexuronide:cation symporter